MKPRTIPLNHIYPKDSTQVRVGLNEDYVVELVSVLEAGEELPPVDLFPALGFFNEFVVADGFHRIEAAERAGLKVIPAFIHSGGPSERLRFALRANATHGLRRTNADKHRAVELALAGWPNVSNVEIAKICAVSKDMVRLVRHEVQPANLAGSPRIGADGKQRKLPVPPPRPQLTSAEFIKKSRIRKLEEALKDAPPAKEWKGDKLTIECSHRDITSSRTIDNNIEAIALALDESQQLRIRSGKPAGVPADACRSSAEVLAKQRDCFDKIGRVIPSDILPLWDKAEEAQGLLSHISAVRGALKKAREENKLIYTNVNISSVEGNLAQAYVELKQVQPHAVCPSCQGIRPEKCKACKGLGFVSELYWERSVSMETKRIILTTVENKTTHATDTTKAI